jgi:ADP-ribose pyrophosphatase YjhB (NUDIX family)
MTRIQRVAAYNVCLDPEGRLLVVRLSEITRRRGWWTLPGGGVEFGEHPADAALRELHEETGLTGRIVELLAVDSQTDARRGTGAPDHHTIRILYRTEVACTPLVFERAGSTDRAAWHAAEDLAAMPLLPAAILGMELVQRPRA